MAILGTFIDLTTESRAGDASDGLSLTTQAHSLPATSAEAIIMQLRSVNASGLEGHHPHVSLVAVDSNASLASIGYYFGSAASVPTIYYDTLKIVFHSTIR